MTQPTRYFVSWIERPCMPWEEPRVVREHYKYDNVAKDMYQYLIEHHETYSATAIAWGIEGHGTYLDMWVNGEDEEIKDTRQSNPFDFA